MALITIPFNFEINVSVAVGDTAYIANVTSTISGWSTTHQHSQQGDIIEIGEITEVQPNLINDESFIIVDDSNTGFSISNTITSGSFIMFSKENKVNLSSILGYYAKIKMVNNISATGNDAELFSVGAEVTESSK